ncbi:MAG: hypothetical protein Kow0068_25130 [Marinilabiliales bacterium]
MNNILVSVPTFLEIAPLLKLFSINPPTKHSNEIINIKFNNRNIDILITGIGIMQTSYYLTKAIINNNYAIAINMGIAGCKNANIKNGEVVEVIKENFADFGIIKSNKFYSIDEYFENEPYCLDIELVNNSPVSNLPKVTGRTVNTLDYDILNLKSTEYFDIETMEGAAFFHVCIKENIKFASIRAISNRIGIHDKSKWNTGEAINNMSKVIYNLILNL